MLSLLAIKIFLENLIIFNVGSKPAIPEIAETVMSNFIFLSRFKSLMITILFFLQKYLIFSVRKNPFTIKKLKHIKNSIDTDSERENERKFFYDMMYKMKENITGGVDKQLNQNLT